MGTEQKWTAEPWEFQRIGYDDGHFSYELNQDGAFIAIDERIQGDIDEPNPMMAKHLADRIQSSVNALAGITDPSKFVAAAKELLAQADHFYKFQDNHNEFLGAMERAEKASGGK